MVWAVRVEYARRALDVIARRTRLAFLNVQAAAEVLPKVVEIMGRELGWSAKKCAVSSGYILRTIYSTVRFKALFLGRCISSVVGSAFTC